MDLFICCIWLTIYVLYIKTYLYKLYYNWFINNFKYKWYIYEKINNKYNIMIYVYEYMDLNECENKELDFTKYFAKLFNCNERYIYINFGILVNINQNIISKYGIQLYNTTNNNNILIWTYKGYFDDLNNTIFYSDKCSDNIYDNKITSCIEKNKNVAIYRMINAYLNKIYALTFDRKFIITIDESNSSVSTTYEFDKKYDVFKNACLSYEYKNNNMITNKISINHALRIICYNLINIFGLLNNHEMYKFNDVVNYANHIIYKNILLNNIYKNILLNNINNDNYTTFDILISLDNLKNKLCVLLDKYIDENNDIRQQTNYLIELNNKYLVSMLSDYII